jgi:adenylylsulfate kinase-like enzyme
MQKLYNECVNAGQLSIEENLRIYKEARILKNVSAHAFPCQHPTAIILGGQNASGKSSLGDKFLKTFQQTGYGMIRIDGDALREKSHHNDERRNAADK